MEDLANKVIMFISLHGAWAGPIVGLLAFGESLAVVGLFIPATTIMVTVGGLIGTGMIEPAPVVLWAIVGASLGDWISYAVGNKIGPSVYRHRLLNRHRTAIARTRLFFRRYGFISVFLGRFLGPIRACVPLVAGVMKMKQRHFQVANVTSALIWVPALFAPGYFAARHLGQSGEFSVDRLIGYGVAIAAFTVLAPLLGGFLLGRRRKRRKVTA